MPVRSITHDLDTLTLTAVAEFPVPVERLWAAWADPRQLERFWGPPTWPATFTHHDMRPGGRAEYHMTGPNGEIGRGWWAFEAVEPGRRFVVRDGFADDAGQPNDALPGSTMEVVFEATAGGSRFVSTSTFASVEAMETVLGMGMIEGLTTALAQMDEVLAELREHGRDFTATVELLDDTRARVTREVRGTLHQVWRAHNEAPLMQQWLLGPDGWTMPVCELADTVGQTYRFEWASAAGDQRFGFTGTLLESEPPRRQVTTERMIGTPGPDTRNELVLTPRPGGRTRIEVTITYPSTELRDMILGTGMVNGMEASYARMESVIG